MKLLEDLGVLRQSIMAQAELYAIVLRDIEARITMLDATEPVRSTPAPARASGGWVTSDGEVFSPPSNSAIEGADDGDDIEIVEVDDGPDDESAPAVDEEPAE